MALPSRIYVGFTVFGIMGLLAIAAYVALLLGGYEAPGSTFGGILPDERSLRAGEVLFLCLATVFLVVFTIRSFRSLLAVARRDQVLRDDRQS